MKLSGTTFKAAIVGTVVGVAGTGIVLATTGMLGRGGVPGPADSAVAAPSVGHEGHSASVHAGHAASEHEATASAGAPAVKEVWACPMKDPATGKSEFTSDKPGRCPTCGMKLKKVVAEAAPASGAAAGAKEIWACPMNDPATGKPEFTSDKPGRCPTCGMKLAKVEPEPEGAGGKKSAVPVKQVAHEGGGTDQSVHDMPGRDAGQKMTAGDHSRHEVAGAANSSVGAGKGQKVKWVCPMGHIVTDAPGDCPVCGMKLVKQTVGQAPGGEATVPGTVMLSAEKQQQIGVRTAEAVVTDVGSDIRASGNVEMDESRVSHVHTKVDGWIEDLRVDTTGEAVRKGQPLLAIYSPELVAAQQEYLQALKTDAALGSSSLLPKGNGLAAAARDRLRNWDFREVDLRELHRTGVPKRSVPIAAHSGGIVLEKKAVHGMRVMPGDELFTIADLSTVWVQAQIYESELPYVKVGTPAKVHLEALPGRTFQGKVAFVYPTLDPMTRTAKVRVVLANPGMVLKPEMFATVTLATPTQRHLAIPTEAVLDSGTRQVAFVAKPGGYFEPRVLKLGGYRGDMAIVKAGIKPGERVVTSANFLIDSESQLQAAMGQMGGSDGAAHKH